jgi:uncharacterized protein YxeA
MIKYIISLILLILIGYFIKKNIIDIDEFNNINQETRSLPDLKNMLRDVY